MHGPAECVGNMLELCAATLYPDPMISLGFTMCLTGDYENIPDKSLVQNCALEHGVSFEDLNACVSDEHAGKGMDLLRSSVERSQSANVTKSCTVRVDEKVWCIRDNAEWKECPHGHTPSDLVAYIRKAKDKAF